MGGGKGCKFRLDKTAGAVATLASLARLGDPTDFDSHSLYLWGEALRAMERHDEALVPLGQAAELDPDNIHIWLALAWCYKRTGQLEQAIEAIERALAVEPEEALLHYNLACYLSLAGRKRGALDHLAKAFALDPSYRQLTDEEPDFDPIRSDPEFQALCGKSTAQG